MPHNAKRGRLTFKIFYFGSSSTCYCNFAIFLSGYSDKEYLKAAIHLRADGYIEKQANPAEVEKIVGRVIERIKRKFEETQNDSLLLSGLVKSFNLVRNELAEALVSGEYAYEEIVAKYYPLYFSWKKEGCFFVANLKMEAENPQGQVGEVLSEYVIEHLESTNNTVPVDFLTLNEHNGDVSILFSSINEETCKLVLQNLQKHLYSSLGIETTIGLSSLGENVDELRKMHRQGKDAVEYSFYFGGGGVISYDIIKNNSEYPKELFENISYDLASINSIFTQISDNKYCQIQKMKRKIYEIYCQVSELNMIKKVYSKDSFSKISLAKIREEIIVSLTTLKLVKNNNYEVSINRAIQYIVNNYHNPNLTVVDVSSSVNLSHTYFSFLFKQNTTQTLNDFIINVRIENAKHLLILSSYKFYEISDMVGFVDSNYFSSVFKKKTGYTPSMYKAIHARKDGL